MVISPRQDWGRPGPPPADSPEAPDDASLAHTLASRPKQPQVVHLTGGDLFRTIGGRPDRSDEPALIVPIDIGLVSIDGGPELTFCAHLVAHGRWWNGRIVAVMNAQWIGSRNVAPAGHPNDGRLDLLDARLAAGQRWKAWNRMKTGSHVPHPDIETRRIKHTELQFEQPLLVRIDGRPHGMASHLEIQCVADACEIAI